ncbi:MAG: tail fiber domain-containing protein [Patescibacteria group bacterium]|nr:tail fiber domain-containing protein [Patescibacteria group bacterium]
MKNKMSSKIISLIFSVMVICFAISFNVFGWTEPTADPPADNVSAPLNASNIGQSKAGGLILNTGGAPTGTGLIVANGKVGIGTSSPGYPLTVSGIIHSIGGIFTLESSDNTFTFVKDVGGAWAGIDAQGINIGDWDTDPSYGEILIGNYDFSVRKDDHSALLVVKNSGNVGIGGTSNPVNRLQIGTNTVSQQWSGATPYILIQGVDNEVATPALTIKDENMETMFELITTGDSTVGRAYFGGNVGIGTESPTEKLDVAGNIYASGTICDSTGCIGSGSSSLWTENGANIYRPSGNVGIGTTSPSQKLDVIGYVRGSSGLCIGSDCRTSWPSGGSGSSLWTERYDLNIYYDSGNVGIGTDSPSQELDLAGNLELEDTTYNSTGVIYKGSDPFIHNYHASSGSGVVPDGQNTFVGVNAGNFQMGGSGTETYHGSYNSFMGADAGSSNTSGYYNSFMGAGAGSSNTSGYYNSFMGAGAGSANISGDNNSFMGAGAGSSNTLGYYNSFMGAGAGSSNASGYYNSFMGAGAGSANRSGDYNSFMGYNAGFSNKYGNNNSFMGAGAGYSTVAGYYNSFIGKDAGYLNYSGDYNSFIGTLAGFFNSTGNYNSSIGSYAGYRNTSGSANVSIGAFAGYANIGGISNSFIGNSAGRYQRYGNNALQSPEQSVYIGANTRSGSDHNGGEDDITNETVIGYGAIGNGANSVTLGNTAVTKTILEGNVGIGTTSPSEKLDVVGSIVASGTICDSTGCIGDGGGGSLWTDSDPNIYRPSGNVGIGDSAPSYKLDVSGTVRATAFLYPSDVRLKKNIEEIPNALEKVLQLKGISFEWIEDNEDNDKKNFGLIAQEVEKIFPEVVATDKISGLKSLEYANLVGPLVEAMKEQQKQIEELKKEIENLKSFQE